MAPPAAADMDIDNPDLETFRQEWRRERGLPTTVDNFRRREVSEASSWTMQPMSSIPSTTATIRGTPEGSWPPDLDEYLPADDRMDTDPPENARSSNYGSDEATFIIATDFGTTFSSVAFTRRHLGKADPEIIVNYPDEPRTNGKSSLEVPTESCYPDVGRYRELLDEITLAPTHEEDVGDLFDDDDDDEPLPYARNENSNGRERRQVSGDHIAIRETVEPRNSEDELPTFLWGYETQAMETQAMMRFPGVHRNQFKRVARSKLMLDDSPDTQKVRDKLRPILNQLKRSGIIKKDEDVIADYLSRLFLHTKEQLILNHGFTDSDSVEHVLCVPNIWSSKACRTMQQAMEIAIRRSELGSLENLFIVAEPEAAATYVLHNNINFRIKPGETFVIIDAGGGTVDATTYTVTNENPLRLKREAVEPTGGLFGSSYLNEAFGEYLLKRLESEEYLKVGESSLQNKIDEAMIDFENRLKRSVNLVETSQEKLKTILMAKVPGLKSNLDKKFYEDHVRVSRNDLISIFRPLLKGISQLMKQQIRLATDAGLQIQKVILIGGFAGSVTLREYVKLELKKLSSKLEDQVELFAPDSCFETAVSMGAVLRALEKGEGPDRITQSSYGFLRTEPHEPTVFQAHGEVRPTVDKLDGKKYVRNTIDWLVKKGEILPPHKEYSIDVEHTFSLYQKYFKCEEVLYVSDTSTESHYRSTHPKNKGAEEAGRIVADMTFLKEKGMIDSTYPDPDLKGKPHYKVEFELVMIIDGRNLRYEARYPKGGDQVQGRGQICIAAAFEPGTD